jgi:BT1 family protein
MAANHPPRDTTQTAGTGAYLRRQLEAALLAPIRALRWNYLPLLMVYFAYGALGIVAIAQSFWVKNALTMTPADLAALSVWLALPWAVKMVFGELVDSVPVLGSQRRVYVFIGAALVAAGLLMLAGVAGGAITFAKPDTVYVIASLLSVTGVVLQDVVADAMSTEVVSRTNADGTPRPPADIDRDLGMVQVLGRLALSAGIFSVAGLSGYLAQTYSYQTVFLIGLIVPVISVSGALLVKLETSERRAIDWRILGGGIAFGLLVTALSVAGVPFAQEIVFVLSMAVIIAMLRRVTGQIPTDAQRHIMYAAIIIFAFRATPSLGEGYRWFTIDVLGFDEGFYGVLQQTGAALGLAAAWLLSDAITRQPVARVLLWLTIVGAIFSLPSIMLVLGVHEWTERMFGIGARSLALIDAAAASPLAQVSMIPLLTLIAVHAPAGHRATWFALMASFMNLALVAGDLQTKYLNLLFHVDRGAYGELAALVLTATAIGIAVPLTLILMFGSRVGTVRTP